MAFRGNLAAGISGAPPPQETGRPPPPRRDTTCFNEIVPSYQVSRSEYCITRAPCPEERKSMSPVEPFGIGKPGWLNTLNASRLNRRLTRSVMGILLYRLAFMLVIQGAGTAWVGYGLNPVSYATNCCVPFFKVTYTLLVS